MRNLVRSSQGAVLLFRFMMLLVKVSSNLLREARHDSNHIMSL